LRTDRAREWPKGAALIAIALVAAAVAVAGCGPSENADTTRGRQLFVSKCGTCHVLAEAASTGTQGPDLDASFAQARAEGMDADTIAGVVKSQVEHPRPSTDNPAVSMPADIVTGEDLDDVAAYVASVAGVPGIKPPPLGNPPQLFAAKCGSCHTLQASDPPSAGTVGPNLDEVLSGQSASEIEQSITDPGAKLTPGYGDLMPADLAAGIPKQKLEALVKFLLQSAGKGG
jgi:mono/diheme cytochrome c family protein